MKETTSPASEPTVLDAKGTPINRLSIVGMSDPHGCWSSHQGLVIDPNSDMEGVEYIVAVYFYGEVCSSNFYGLQKGSVGNVRDWDGIYGGNDRNSETDFLFKDNVWKKSPRVRFFKSSELVVLQTWGVEQLASRLFGRKYHTLYMISAKLPQSPNAFMCWIEECRSPATEVALCNVWGSVYPLFVCKPCNEKYNGMCSDDLPPRKKIYLAPDGTSIDIAG
jgi:hypothetical protein